MKVIKKYMSHTSSENIKDILGKGEVYFSDTLSHEIEYIKENEDNDISYVYEVTFKRIKQVITEVQTKVKDIK